MRYRRLDANGDYTFGFGQAGFYINQPEAIAQAVLTRLRLWAGEWFIDISDGTEWSSKVLGNNTASIRDAMIKARIAETPGVLSIVSYQSIFDRATRKFNIYTILNTIYGILPSQSGLTTAPPIPGLVVPGGGATLPTGTIGSGMPAPSNSRRAAALPAGPGGPVLVFTLDVPGEDILDGSAVLG